MSTFEHVRAELEDRLGATVPAEVLHTALDEAGAGIFAPGDLFGPAKAADYLGVNRTTISRWKREGYMPEPYADLGTEGTWTVWTRAQLEALKAQRDAEEAAARRSPAAAA